MSNKRYIQEKSIINRGITQSINKDKEEEMNLTYWDDKDDVKADCDACNKEVLGYIEDLLANNGEEIDNRKDFTALFLYNGENYLKTVFGQGHESNNSARSRSASV